MNPRPLNVWNWPDLPTTHNSMIEISPAAARVYIGTLLNATPAAIGNPEFKFHTGFDGIGFQKCVMEMFRALLANESVFVCAACGREVIREIHTIRRRFETFVDEVEGKVHG